MPQVSQSVPPVADAVHLKKAKKATMVAVFGTFIEYYDFSVYGYVAATLAVVFFPSDDPVMGLLNTLLVFGAAFVVRPIGAIFFGRLGDRNGPAYQPDRQRHPDERAAGFTDRPAARVRADRYLGADPAGACCGCCRASPPAVRSAAPPPTSGSGPRPSGARSTSPSFPASPSSARPALPASPPWRPRSCPRRTWSPGAGGSRSCSRSRWASSACTCGSRSRTAPNSPPTKAKGQTTTTSPSMNCSRNHRLRLTKVILISTRAEHRHLPRHRLHRRLLQHRPATSPKPRPPPSCCSPCCSPRRSYPHRRPTRQPHRRQTDPGRPPTSPTSLLTLPSFLLMNQGGRRLAILGLLLGMIPYALCQAGTYAVMPEFFPVEVRHTGVAFGHSVGAVIGGAAPRTWPPG